MLKIELQNILNVYEKLDEVSGKAFTELSAEDYSTFLNNKSELYLYTIEDNDITISRDIINKQLSADIKQDALNALITNFKYTFDFIHFVNGMIQNILNYQEQNQKLNDYYDRLIRLQHKVNEVLHLAINIIKENYALFDVKESDTNILQEINSSTSSNSISKKSFLFLYRDNKGDYNANLVIQRATQNRYDFTNLLSKMRLVNNVSKLIEEIKLDVSCMQFVNRQPQFISGEYNPLPTEEFESIKTLLGSIPVTMRLKNELNTEIKQEQPIAIATQEKYDDWHITDDVCCGVYKCPHCDKLTWIADEDIENTKFCSKCGGRIDLEK